MIDLRLGDCLEVMQTIADKSVDLILCDLPYGTTACKWDSVIPFEPLWTQYRRIAKPNAAIVLTASQPFTSALIMSNAEMFRYCWVWEKSKASNFVHVKHQPLKAHEDIVVFSQMGAAASRSGKSMKYNPVMVPGDPYFKNERSISGVKHLYSEGRKAKPTRCKSDDGARYPRSVQYFRTAESEGGHHPTQKPVALMEYLIRTYTNEGDTVLDNCMGSGTTGVACANTGRKFIGIERDPGYFAVAQKRIADSMPREQEAA